VVRESVNRREASNLRGVVVEDDGAEVSAVVVGDEVLGGVGALHTARAHALVLQQSLVQGEQDLKTGGNQNQNYCLRFFANKECAFVESVPNIEHSLK